MSKNIVKSTGIILIVNLTVKLLGFARESVIANSFGATTLTDAYLVAYTIPYFLQAILGAALVAAVVPVITRYLAEGRLDEANRIGSLMINVTCVILLILTLIGMLATPWLVRLTAPGFGDAQIALSVRLALIMFPLVLFMGLASVITGLLNANYRFVAGALAPGVSNLVIIVFVLLFSSWGVNFLAVGTLISFVCSSIAVIIAIRRTNFRYKFALDFRHPVVVKALKDILPIALGVAVTQIYFFFNRVFASGLAEGSISALNFANKLMLLPVGIFVAAVAAVIYPAFSEAGADKDRGLLPRTVDKGVSLVSLVAVPATFGLIVLREPLVQLLFERGAFDHEATVITAYALLFFAIGVLPASLNMVLARAYYAISDVKTPVVIGFVSILANVLFSLLLLKPFSHGGLALANSLAAFLNTGLLYACLHKRLPLLNIRSYLVSFIKMLLASLVMSAAVAFCAHCLKAVDGGTTALIIQVGASALAGCLVYVAIALALRLREVKSLLEIAGKFSPKRLTKT